MYKPATLCADEQDNPSRSRPKSRLKTGDAARYCGCSKSLLEKLRLRGSAPAYIKLSPRFVVYDTADLDAWLASGRSKWRRAMSRNKRSRSGGDKFVQKYRWMMRCPAYRSLSCYAQCLLDQLKLRYDGGNNGYIGYSVREAARDLNCSAPTAMNAFRELEDRGFTRIREKGVFSRKVRHSTEWILTEYDYANRPPTKDFMRWEAPAEIQKAAKRRSSVGATSLDRTPPQNGNSISDGAIQLNRNAAKMADYGAGSLNTSNIPGESKRDSPAQPLMNIRPGHEWGALKWTPHRVH